MVNSNKNVYVGNRYVPKFSNGEWDNSKEYESLTIVTHDGGSYTSKKNVPAGIDINNEEYWVMTGNYNAQVEAYRQEVTTLRTYVNEEIENTINSLSEIVVNVKKPPSNLEPLTLNGIDYEQEKLQNILDWVGNIGGGKVYIPEGTLLHDVIYIPNNVILEGSGYNTVLKLRDNSPYINERIPTGIYPKKHVDFFSVRNLTYDGNTTNNIDIHSITGENFNDYYAHGLSNSYTDENTNTDSPSVDPERRAKNFLFENLHIKEVLRNCILISGRNDCKGEVRNVILENAYADHFIYESHTNTIVNYSNVTLKGFWSGAGIVAEAGQFNGITLIDYIKNPSTNRNQSGIIEFRYSYQEGNQTKPFLKDVNLSFPFGDVFYILSKQSISKAPKGFYLENLVINQTDSSLNGSTGIPLSVLSTNGINDIVIRNIEAHNVLQLNLLGTSPLANNITIENVKFFYNPLRPLVTNDGLLVLSPNGNDMNFVTLRNIYIPEKAPSLIKFRRVNPSQTTIRDVNFDNIYLNTSNGDTPLIDFTNVEHFELINFNISNSTFKGFEEIDLITLQHQYDIHLNNVNYNNVNSKIGSKGTLQILEDWTGTVRYSVNEFNQVTLTSTNLTVGTTTGAPLVVNIPERLSPRAGLVFPLQVYNYTKNTVVPNCFIITGSERGIRVIAIDGIEQGDILRFNVTYDRSLL